MLLGLARRATVFGASPFLALPNAGCCQRVAAARPAITKRATPVRLQSTLGSMPAGRAPAIIFHEDYDSREHGTKFRLDVGGAPFVTTRETLCAASGSVLASTFAYNSSSAVCAGENDHLCLGGRLQSTTIAFGTTFNVGYRAIGGSTTVPDAFIDSDPETFAWILGFLRRGCRLVGMPSAHIFEQVRADAQSFGIDELVSALDTKTMVQPQRHPCYETSMPSRREPN